MPKKKKKGRAAREAAANNSVGTPSPSQKKHSPPTPSSTSKPPVQADLISVRLLPTTKSPLGKKMLKFSPTIILHESDADKLDVTVGDRVFIISTTDSLQRQIQAVAIARVRINDEKTGRSKTPKSPIFGNKSNNTSNNHKKNKLPSGHCHLSPNSLAEYFLSFEDDRESQNISREIRTPEPTASLTAATPSTSSNSKSGFSFARGGGGDQLIASPPPKPKPTSSSKSNFSFAKGGGGDQLISPRASTNSTTLSTPSSVKSKPDRRKNLLQIVPFDSDLGDILASIFCKSARILSIRPDLMEPKSENQKDEEEIQSSPPLSSRMKGFPLLQQLVVAHTEGEYLAHGTSFTISMQGKTVKCQVDEVTHENIGNKMNERDEVDNVLANNMERLSIEQTDQIVDKSDRHAVESSELEISLRSMLSEMSEKHKMELSLYFIGQETKIQVATDTVDEGEKENTIFPNIDRQKSLVAGLDKTLQQVQSALESPLMHFKLFKNSAKSLKPPKGILLHGPSGVGKSALALQIGQNFASDGLYHVQHINCTSIQSQTSFIGQAENKLVKLFSDAQKPRSGKKGCLLILDDIHLISPRREGIDIGADRLTSTLLALLDGMTTSDDAASDTFYPTVILAITTNPGALDAALRRPGRLDSEIEVPLPDEPSTRLKILKFQLDSLGTESNFSDSEWLSLARLAKGFTGADLRLAAKEGLRNALLLHSDGRKITFSVMKKAILSTKPSAIKAVTVEVPSVPWSSIGGMDEVKRQLRDAIELPLTHGETFRRLGIRPPRGVLLYGPPGCSKTLMARALATEGHMNFLAVKGPELLSKWLGESERALAALFRRARLASPAIIFFDEIDAIASKRGGGSSGGGERLLSQLLTELDGIQQHKDSSGREGRVVIVCATNRPDLLDGALMRPGRIDRMIYVGVPDEKSRKKILEIGLQRSCIENIDIPHLASNEISGGLSGAELIGACRDSALKAMEDFDEGRTSSDDPVITTEHVLTTLTEMERQITPQNLEFYASFQRKST